MASALNAPVCLIVTLCQGRESIQTSNVAQFFSPHVRRKKNRRRQQKQPKINQKQYIPAPKSAEAQRQAVRSNKHSLGQ